VSKTADRHTAAGLELLARLRRRQEEVVGGPGLLKDLKDAGVPAPPPGLVRAARRGEKFDVIVCAPYRAWEPLIFPDNRVGVCAFCREAIQYRPDAPRGRRLCAVCALQLERGDA